MKGKDPGIEERRLPMRLHVRAIIRDGMSAFVGSQSLRKDELENRREVGLIINNPAVARKIMQVFESDWADCGKGAKSKAKAAKAAKAKAA
jgi:phosphatidylserine/phosphatidylglycerophosphate/cardiolipin synthase-like enzyme